MFLKSQEHLRYKMTTFKAGLAQNTHWLCGNSSRGPTRWKSFPETRDHHLGSRSENTNSMADLLGPPLPPPPPLFILSWDVTPVESNLLPYGSGMTVMFCLCRERQPFLKRQDENYLPLQVWPRAEH